MAVITGRGINAAPALLRWMRVAQPGVSARTAARSKVTAPHRPRSPET